MPHRLGRPELASKLYHHPAKDPDRPDKLRAMLERPPDLPAIREKGSVYVQIAWPVGLIEDNQGRFAGVPLMPRQSRRRTAARPVPAVSGRVAGIPACPLSLLPAGHELGVLDALGLADDRTPFMGIFDEINKRHSRIE